MTLPGCNCDVGFAVLCPFHGMSMDERERRDRVVCSSGLREIHDALQDAGYRVARGRGGETPGLSAVVFRHADGSPGSLHLRAYCSPARTYRIKVDHGFAGAGVRAMRSVGIDRAWLHDDLRSSPWRMELTLLETEFRPIAAWLARFLRQSPDLFELPSVPMVRGWDRPPYAWSEVALAQQDAWKADDDARRARRKRAA